MPTKILAIDDSKTMRLAIKITFAAEDAEVVAVSKGSEAVARAQKLGADIVLLDHRLATGEPSGYDVCRTLKSNAATRDIPVVMMCSSQEEIDEAAITACGADGSIAKPFDSQALIEKVADVVSRGSVARPNAAAARPSAPVPAAPRPAAAAPRPAAAAPRPAAAGSAGTAIPVAIPIPFTAADSPTPGMLARLQAAQGSAAAGLDPQAVQALLSLSQEVVERVVWEVVPELAEHIIKEKAQ